MDLRGETELIYVLDEFSLSILDEHDGDSSRSSVLPSEKTLGLYSVFFGIIPDNKNIVTPDISDQWINLKAFLGRLTAANTCHLGMGRVGYLCDSFIRDDDVRETLYSMSACSLLLSI